MTDGSGAGLRLLVTVSFNRNQLVSHLAPLVALPSVDRITLVADHASPPLPKLRTVVPPAWLKRVLGRAGAKLVVCALVALRERPHWVVTYSIMPHGITGSIVARLVGARSMYHTIYGELEWEGGGWRGGNQVLRRLRRPSQTIERFLLRVIRSYTVVVTLGERARRELMAKGVSGDRIVVIPPTIATVENIDGLPDENKRYDLIWLGRLVPEKRLDDVLNSVATLHERHPHVRLAIAGIGPLEDDLRKRCTQLGIEENVDFIGFRDPPTLRQGGVFVRVSEWEGVSIAMLEAMACGLPVVVTRVGDTAELVRNGENGYLVQVGDVAALTARLDTLLSDPSLRARLGDAARRDALAHAGVQHVAGLYDRALGAPAAKLAPVASASAAS